MNLFRLAVFLAGTLLLGQCASYTDQTREVRSLYRFGEYAKALAKLESSGLKTDDKNKLLYQLEQGMIFDRLGDHEKAQRALLSATETAKRLFTTSVSRTAATFVVSDSSSEYSGEDYEKVAIHAMLALSFLEQGRLRSARVEARRINTELHSLNAAYEEKTRNRYSEDAFALYLSGMIYEALQEWDDAFIDYKKAYDAYEKSYRRFHSGPTPKSLIEALYHTARKRRRSQTIKSLKKSHPEILQAVDQHITHSGPKTGQLIILHELGHIATKKAEEFVVGIGKQIIRFSFPTLHRQQMHIYGKTGAYIGSQNRIWHPSENLQDFTAIAYFTLEDRRLRMIARQTVRLLAKAKLTDMAHDKFGVLGGLAANLVAAASETADTRSWTLLPEAIQVTRMALPAGAHDIAIYNDGKLTRAESIDIQAGELKFLRIKE